MFVACCFGRLIDFFDRLEGVFVLSAFCVLFVCCWFVCLCLRLLFVLFCTGGMCFNCLCLFVCCVDRLFVYDVFFGKSFFLFCSV